MNRVPYVVYADFEALLPEVEEEENVSQGESYTKKLQEHVVCGYCYYVVSANPEEEFNFPNPVVQRGTADGIPVNWRKGKL